LSATAASLETIMDLVSLHTVTLRFRDGKETQIKVGKGDTTLDAALAASIPLLHQCRSGSCSSCMAKLVNGRAPMRAGVSSTLLRGELEAGNRLLCLTEPQSDCVFELPYDSDAGQGSTRKAHAFVNSIVQLAPDVVRLSLELAEGEWMDFRPGQFVQVTLPGGWAVRSYSPATTPADLPRLDLLIRLLPGGAMSTWLTERGAPDDVLQIEGPFGAFFLRDKVRAPHILVAGGTGLAPILSILDRLRRQPGRKPKTLLSFGCASPESLFALDELELRRHFLPSLTVRISVDRGANAALLSGTPVDALRDEDAADPDTVAYVCGPPNMIDAARRRLEAIGVNPANIFTEQFVSTR
jgi:benzoate/toluate 1,2-dioxygenase reductase component